MRKYLLLAILLPILGLILSFTFTIPAYADHNFGEGQGNCMISNPLFEPNAGANDKHCAQGFFCKDETIPGEGAIPMGRCVKPNQGEQEEGEDCQFCGPNTNDLGCLSPRTCKAPLQCHVGEKKCFNPAATLQCNCIKPGDAANGQNGFKCGPDPNAPIAYCDSGNACYKKDQNSPNAEAPDGGVKYPNSSLMGIACAPPGKGNAICKCKPGGGTDGQNFFECYREGENPNVMTGGGSCGSSKDKCYDTPNEIIDASNTGNHSGFVDTWFFEDGFNIIGVACRQPVATCKCVNPGKNGTKINRFTCEQQTSDAGRPLKGSDYCTYSNEACYDDPNARMEFTPNKIYNGAPVTGVICKEAAIVPPPPPPCAQPLDAEGRCLSFLTAFGKLDTNAGAFITSIFAVLLSVSGGIALLLIMRAGYLMMTSAGNAERLNSGREQLIAAIVGLLFIIFSFVILQVIGVEILQIPGFAA